MATTIQLIYLIKKGFNAIGIINIPEISIQDRDEETEYLIIDQKFYLSWNTKKTLFTLSRMNHPICQRLPFNYTIEHILTIYSKEIIKSFCYGKRKYLDTKNKKGELV